MNRRFAFRLERVRRVRDIEERVARAERARAEGAARAAESRRDAARAALEGARAALREILRERPPARLVLGAQRTLDANLAHLRVRAESALTLRTQAERLAAAHRQRKTAARALEELKSRARIRHAAELEKQANAELDEIAQRRSRGGSRPSSGKPRKGESASSPCSSPSDQEPGPHR